MGSNILVILGHPQADSFNGALARTYAEGACSTGANVELLQLGDLSFDPVLRAGYGQSQPWESALEGAWASLQSAQHVVWVFPVWWASLPALLKGFVDRLLLPGRAFVYEKGSALPQGLLRGRTTRIVATMDSPWWWYRFRHGRAAHRALKHGTLRFVGMKSVGETTLYKVREMNEHRRASWLVRLRRVGERDAMRLRR